MKENYKNIVLFNRHMSELNPLFLGFRHCSPGPTYGPVIRNHTLIHYIVSGKGTFCKGNTTYTVHAGEAFLVLPGESVQWTPDPIEPWHYEWIAFEGELAKRFCEKPAVFSLSSTHLSKMLAAAELTMPEYRITALMFEMYVDLFQENPINPHYVTRICDYINSYYSDKIKVENLARMVHLDRHYLTRIFKEKMGITIQEYIGEIRLKNACKHLCEDISIQKTSILCGYSSSHNFSRMFKRKFGVSPSKWKEENRKLQQ